MATFTIRDLLILVTISAVCSLLIRTDWIAAVAFTVSALYLTIAVRLFKATSARRLHLATRFFVLLPSAVIAWFSVVDSSHSIDWCTQCSSHRYIDELRVCGIPVWATPGEFHVNNVNRLQIDLGFPCNHKFDREHLIRTWGLLYCTRPCTCVMCCLSGDPDYYNENVSRLARQFALENPVGASALYKLVVHENNYDAMHEFIGKIKERDSELQSRVTEQTIGHEAHDQSF